MIVDEPKRDQWIASQRRSAKTRASAADDLLSGGGGGGILPPRESRVSALEVHADYARDALGKIDAKLDTLIVQTASLPTKSDLTTFSRQWLVTAVAAIALIVGGIIGDLGWIKAESSTPAPAAQSSSPTLSDVKRR